jgi:hypothetical protein
MNIYYTYAYLREDGTPYYIGKGKKYRATSRTRLGIKPPKDKSKIIFLKHSLNEEEAFKHEKYMISVFGRIDLGTGVLRNKTNGGEGASGIIPWNKGIPHSKETKNKIKEKRAQQVFSPETREKMGNVRKGRKHTEDTKNKMSFTMKGKNKGKKRTQEQKQRISQRQLNKPSKYRYEITYPDGKKETIDNLPKFCRMNKDLKLDNSTLLKVAKGIHKHHKGFKVIII